MTTKQTGHTPGPWVARDRGVFYMAKDGDKDVSVFIADCDCNRLGVDKSNACLIAAAPELLEALKALYNDTTQQENWDKAEQAISKAEGETR